jgi:hypothetical protein
MVLRNPTAATDLAPSFMAAHKQSLDQAGQAGRQQIERLRYEAHQGKAAQAEIRTAGHTTKKSRPNDLL